MKKRCVIVGGAGIGDYEFIRGLLSEEDYLIFCDCGLKHLKGLGFPADLVIGDFDSYDDPHLPVETIVLPVIKDDTDTVYAVKEGIRRGFREFLLIGVIGARFDHSLSNVSILFDLDTKGLHGRIVDDYSEMEVVSKAPAAIPDTFPFFSLLNLTGTAKGITIENAKYELQDAEITCYYQYGVSNEPLPGRTAFVTVREGRLLLIRDRV